MISAVWFTSVQMVVMVFAVFHTVVARHGISSLIHHINFAVFRTVVARHGISSLIHHINQVVHCAMQQVGIKEGGNSKIGKITLICCKNGTKLQNWSHQFLNSLNRDLVSCPHH